MVLLVFLAIVWAVVGVYWLKTRVPSPSLPVGSYTRRLSSLDMMSSQRSASVYQLRGNRAAGPGHSLTQPARVPAPGTRPGRVTSEQARLRRRNVLLGLAAFAAITLVGVFAIGGTTMILVHLLADAALLGFVLLLVQYQREIELERTRNLPVYAEPRRSLAPTGTDGRY